MSRCEALEEGNREGKSKTYSTHTPPTSVNDPFPAPRVSSPFRLPTTRGLAMSVAQHRPPSWFLVVFSALSLFSIPRVLRPCECFSPFNGPTLSAPQKMSSNGNRHHSTLSASLFPDSNDQVDPLDELTEERKANLFQFLLRDFEVEGVPLLGCDASETNVFLAALWTTMAELSETDNQGKVCLVFESIPMETLKIFVEEFSAIKNQSSVMENIPELQRVSVSLVGRGLGPAMVIEASNRTDAEKVAYNMMIQSAPIPDEHRWTCAMKTFFGRTCSRRINNSVFRIIGSTDVCNILSGYWTSVCELLSLPREQISSIVLSYPPVREGTQAVIHDRYVAISLLMNRMLFLYNNTKDEVSSFHLQPFYDRDKAPFENDNPSPGHLSPSWWIQQANFDDDPKENLSQENLRLQNFLRRSPLPSVIIQRHDGVHDYNINSVITQSEQDLEEALSKEMAMIS